MADTSSVKDRVIRAVASGGGVSPDQLDVLLKEDLIWGNGFSLSRTKYTTGEPTCHTSEAERLSRGLMWVRFSYAHDDTKRCLTTMIHDTKHLLNTSPKSLATGTTHQLISTPGHSLHLQLGW